MLDLNNGQNGTKTETKKELPPLKNNRPPIVASHNNSTYNFAPARPNSAPHNQSMAANYHTSRPMSAATHKRSTEYDHIKVS